MSVVVSPRRSRESDAELAKNLVLATSPLPQTPIILSGHEPDVDGPNEEVDEPKNKHGRSSNEGQTLNFDEIQNNEDKQPLQLPSSGEGPGGPQLVGTDVQSQATLRLKKRKEGQEIANSLEEARARFGRRMAHLDAREQINKTKKDELETMLKNLQPIVDENDRKVSKAKARLAVETSARDQVDADVARLYTELQTAKSECITAEALMHELQRHSRFLHEAVDMSNSDAKGLHFSSVSDLLTRHATFVQTNKDLSSQVDKASHELESFRNRTSVDLSMSQTRQLDLTSRLERMRSRIEMLNREAAELDGIEEAQLADAEENMRTWTATANAVANLYKRIEATTPRGAALGLEVQLSSIKKEKGNGNLNTAITAVSAKAKTAAVPDDIVNKLTMMSARLGDLLSMVVEYPAWALKKVEEKRLKEEKIAEEARVREKMIEDARLMEEALKSKSVSNNSNSATTTSSSKSTSVSTSKGSSKLTRSNSTLDEEALMGVSGGSAGSGASAVRAARASLGTSNGLSLSSGLSSSGGNRKSARPGSALPAAPPAAVVSKAPEVIVSSSAPKSRGLAPAAPSAYNTNADPVSKKAYKLKDNVYRVPFSIEAEVAATG
jgi:hypothetical protein